MITASNWRFLLASFASTITLFMPLALITVAGVLGVLEEPGYRPDGTPDNAPMRGAGILLVTAPFLFIGVFFTTLVVTHQLRATGDLKKRTLYLGATVFSALIGIWVAIVAAASRQATTFDIFSSSLFAVALAFVSSASAVWVWWRVARYAA